MRIAPVGQTAAQVPQPMHLSAGRVKSTQDARPLIVDSR
jgi:hypothetical protein